MKPARSRTVRPVQARRRRPLPLLTLLLALSLLAACGGGSEVAQDAEPADAGTAAPADASTAAPADAGTAAPDDAGTAAPADGQGEPLTLYSGRNEELVGPILERFTETSGIEVDIRYGDTAELAATILEEGENSPADVYFGQDAGALGALQQEGVLSGLADEQLELVEDRFRAADGTWVGVSGRARVLVYNTESLTEDEVPGSVLDLTDPEWEGRVGWAPTNASFQAFVTAMRVELGDEATREWLEGMIANGVQVYEGNTGIVEAATRGEIDLGLVNHYYLYQFLAEDPDTTAANAFTDGSDVGSLVNVAGVGVLTTTDQPDEAAQLVDFLLSEEAQEYFATETYEYPLVRGIPADDRLPALDSIETPDLELSDLEDLQGTLELLRTTGALQ